MEPVVTTRWAPNAVEQTREIEDFDAVVRLYWPKVFRFALASLSDRDAAESLAQECFLKAYLARQLVEQSGDGPEAQPQLRPAEKDG